MVPVSRAQVVPEPSEPEPARTVSADLNRELLRGAWERHRERNLNKGYSLNPPSQPESEARVISNEYIPPSRDGNTPSNRGLTTSVFEFSDKGNEAKFDAIPEIDHQRELTEPRPTPRPQPVRPRVRPTADSPRPLPSNEAHFDVIDEPERDIVRQTERDSLRVTLPDLDEVAQPEPIYSAEPSDTSYDAYSDDAFETRGESVREPRDESVREPRDEHYFEPWDAAAPVDHAARDGHDIWANIPRCCRTCRDFRPAGSGERGWCNNQWAFKHRRMVDSDDLPCETSIGHWWVPGDEAWQGEFDVSALGQPTPLMDRWFGPGGGEERIADAAHDRRRRKTGSW
jgi:hypothetical protein